MLKILVALVEVTTAVTLERVRYCSAYILLTAEYSVAADWIVFSSESLTERAKSRMATPATSKKIVTTIAHSKRVKAFRSLLIAALRNGLINSIHSHMREQVPCHLPKEGLC